jgi:uncharacterized protein DUF6615
MLSGGGSVAYFAGHSSIMSLNYRQAFMLAAAANTCNSSARRVIGESAVIPPGGTMLCHFVALPGVLADFLQSGRALRRGFREESVTDLLMGSLLVGQSWVISRDAEG